MTVLRIGRRGRADLVTSVVLRLTVVSAPRVLLLAVCLIAAIGYVDLVTGPDLALGVAYQVPVFLAATGRRGIGIAVAALSAAVWTLIQSMQDPARYALGIIPAWNFLARFLVLYLVAALVRALAGKLDEERGLSRSDFLTGLPNARAFRETADRTLAGMLRSRSLLTAAFIDIDNFKAVNDAHGHARGDELLTLVGRTLAAGMRPQDTVARLGGDEFAVLLPGIDRDEAQARLQGLHGGLHAATAGMTPAVGFSIGAVTFTDPPGSSSELLSLPDRLMYRVKLRGKDRVWTETAETAENHAGRSHQ